MKRDAEILLVEDNPADIKLASKILSGLETPIHLSVVTDGVEALAFLRREGAFRDSPRPDLILLDLNLPKKDGREVLREIKEEPALKIIPVLVLTTSGAESDLKMCYDLQVNCFLQKPVDLDSYRHMMASIEAFWFRSALLPKRVLPE